MVLNSSKEKISDSSQTIAVDLKKALNNLQGAFFDVQASKVNYEEMKKSQAYQNYLAMAKKLKGFNLNTLKTDKEKKAFWINIYNILIIHGVIELEIRNSVKEVFNFFRRISYEIGGYNFTPDSVEFGILRKNARHPLLKLHEFGWLDPRKRFSLEKKDPRIHFGLVCASNSCPPIEFYEAEKIDSQLDLAARSFLNRNGAVLDKGKNTLFLSQVFMWFKEDFGKNKKEIINLIVPYLGDEKRAYINSHRQDLKIDYLPYDWNLNRSLK
jgi:hypothetical protein